MEQKQIATVIDKTGRRGILGEAVADAETGSDFTTVQLENGQSILVLTNMLIAREDGSYYLPLDLEELAQQRRQRTTLADQTGQTGAQASEEIILPLSEEQLTVGKREVQSGLVRIHTHVVEREETAQATLMRERVEVERVPINQFVSAASGPREEGDVLIVPVYEEQLVVEKRLVLKEELHIRRIRASEEWSEPVTLRREEVEIERVAGADTTVQENTSHE